MSSGEQVAPPYPRLMTGKGGQGAECAKSGKGAAPAGKGIDTVKKDVFNKQSRPAPAATKKAMDIDDDDPFADLFDEPTPTLAVNADSASSGLASGEGSNLLASQPTPAPESFWIGDDERNNDRTIVRSRSRSPRRAVQS